MTRRDSAALPAAYCVAATMVCLYGGAAFGQGSANDAKQATSHPAYAVAAGPGSLTGVWNTLAFKDVRGGAAPSAQPLPQTADGQAIPYQSWAAELVAQNRRNAQNGTAIAGGSTCLPDGMPSMMQPPIKHPLQILETPGQVTVLFESDYTFRIIHLNEKHPADPDPGYFGNSVGHWQADTLVVDTVGLTDKTTVFGIPHSEDMHLIEHLRRLDENTMEDRITIDDPKTYTRAWTWLITLKQVSGISITEHVCEPGSNGVDTGADGSVRGPSQ